MGRDRGRRRGWCCAASLSDQLGAAGAALPLKAACSVATLGAVAWTLRPRGWCNTDLVQIAASEIDRRGAFAARHIAAGTVLGSYPGFARPPREMAAKVSRHPGAQHYVFSTDSGWFLDPTDARGRMREGRLWGLVPPHLAFVNEPSVGQMTNLAVRQGGSNFDLLYVAQRDIIKDEELLIDYGLHYSRTGYGSIDKS